MNLIIEIYSLEINKLLSSIKKNLYSYTYLKNWIYIKAANKEKHEAYVALLRNFTKHLRKRGNQFYTNSSGKFKRRDSQCIFSIVYLSLWCQKYFKK